VKLYEEKACKMPPVASAEPEAVPENRLAEPDAGPAVDWSRIVQGEPLLQTKTVSLIVPAKAGHAKSEIPKTSQPVRISMVEFELPLFRHYRRD
jgi:hypothetical protein